MGRILAIAVAVLALAGCSSAPIGATSASSPATASSMDPNPSPAAAKSWPSKWCSVKPGMTRSQVRAIMGTPTKAFGLASGNPQMQWYAYEFGFDAFMDANDRVRQLDVNDIQLTASEKAAIHCDFIRVAK